MHQKKKQMLNRKAVKSRKSYDSMDCEKKEKYLNAIRNQSAIDQQNRKISKLHVDVCISVLPENKRRPLLCMHCLQQIVV